MPTFNKAGRLRKRAEFTAVSAHGNKWVTPHFVLVSSESVYSWARLGITVSKKVGNAVSRNRVKRQVREFFRINREIFPVSDYNIIARSGASHLDYSALCQELANALSKLGRKSCH